MASGHLGRAVLALEADLGPLDRQTQAVENTVKRRMDRAADSLDNVGRSLTSVGNPDGSRGRAIRRPGGASP